VVRRGIHDHFHHIVGLCFEAKRPDLGTARSEVATSQDAARPDAKAPHSAYAAEVKLQLQQARQVPGLSRDFGTLVGGIGRRMLAPVRSCTIYRFPCNCICLTEDVPSN